MDEAPIPGQARADARRRLARAARALDDEGALATEPLLAALRAAAPSGHEGAGADRVDVGFVARMRGLGGDALLSTRAVQLVPAPWRAPWRFAPAHDGALELHAAPRADLAGDALLLVTGLALEAAKLAHGLGVDATELRAAFSTPSAARDALAALRAGGSARLVEHGRGGQRVDGAALAALVGERPCFVVAGDGAARMHDLLAPFARRLRAPLVALGERAAPRPPRDDAVYAGIDALVAVAPETLSERLDVERADGIVPVGGGAVALRCEAIPDGEVDRRCREAMSLLKRARALLVLVEPRGASLAATLDAVGGAVRAVALITGGTAACTPDSVIDAASDHVAPVDNALLDESRARRQPLLTVPSLALAVPEHACDGSAFALAQAVLGARARGTLDAAARMALRVVPRGDHGALSHACIEVLARMAPRPARARPR